MIYKTRLLIISSLLLFAGCYNNAHIQTQRELQKGESSTNVGVIVPSISSDERFETNIAAQRIEFSHIKGFKKFEFGYYGGVGIVFADVPIGLGGLILRKNINTDSSPIKLGLHAEYGQFKEGARDRKRSGFQIRPSITTLTSSKKSSYLGLHGLLSISRRTEDAWHYTSVNTESGSTYELVKAVEEENYYTYGYGVTMGSEKFSNSFSVQTQIDISMVKNIWDDREPNRSKIDHKFVPLVSLSAGINFFNPIEQFDQDFIPMPNVEKTERKGNEYTLKTDEPESYSFKNSSTDSYAFFDQSSEKTIQRGTYSPYELAQRHMNEPTVHRFLTAMTPFITYLGLFIPFAEDETFEKLEAPAPVSYSYALFGIVPQILSDRIAKNIQLSSDESENMAFKEMYVKELRKLRHKKTIKDFGIMYLVGVLPVSILLHAWDDSGW